MVRKKKNTGKKRRRRRSYLRLTKKKFCYTCRKVTVWQFRPESRHSACNECGRNIGSK